MCGICGIVLSDPSGRIAPDALFLAGAVRIWRRDEAMAEADDFAVALSRRAGFEAAHSGRIG